MLNLGPVWGVDIGDSAVKAVKLKRVGDQVALLDFQVVRYSDVGGEAGARREGLLAPALDALKAMGMGKDRCFVSIAPQAVFSRFISLPPVDKRRVPEIVLYEARQQIPFALSEVIWAYQAVRKEFVPGEEIEIGLFAIKREVVQAYIDELYPIRKQLHGIQVGPLALYNFIWHEMDIEQPTVILDIGCQSTDLLIVEGDKFWLRNLPIAGNTFTSVLERKLNITQAEAEKLKLGMADSRHRRKLLEVLRPSMRDLVAEIQRSIGYYKSLAHDVKFEKIVMVGDGYRLFGLDRFLAEQLQYKISPVRQLEKVPYQGAHERVSELTRLIPSLGPAVGLGLQGIGRSRGSINLLPDDFVIGRELHSKRFSGLIAGGLAWAIVACFGMKEMRAVSGMEDLAGKGTDTLQKVKKLEGELNKAKKLRDTKRIAQFEQMGRYREYISRVIGAVLEHKPDDFKIKSDFTYALGRVSSLEPVKSGVAEGRSPTRGSGARGGEMSSDSGTGADSLIMTFQVEVKNREQNEMKEELLALKEVRILPEGLRLVKKMLVDDIQMVTIPGVAELGEKDDPGLSARVQLALLLPEEIDKALVEHRKQEQKREEEAKKKRLAEEAARTAEAGKEDDKAIEAEGETLETASEK